MEAYTLTVISDVVMGKVDLPREVSGPDCLTKALLPLPEQPQSS